MHPQSVTNPAIRDRYRFVAEAGVPTWRRGPAAWDRDPDHHTIENCLAPLASDEQTVDMLRKLGALRCPRERDLSAAGATRALRMKAPGGHGFWRSRGANQTRDGSRRRMFEDSGGKHPMARYVIGGPVEHDRVTVLKQRNDLVALFSAQMSSDFGRCCENNDGRGIREKRATSRRQVCLVDYRETIRDVPLTRATRCRLD